MDTDHHTSGHQHVAGSAVDADTAADPANADTLTYPSPRTT